MTSVPPDQWLISVDDHIIEPPNVWLDRLPSKYHDRAPRMARSDREAVWQYEDKVVPTSGLSVAAGKRKEQFSPDPVPFDEMRAGAYDAAARVEDMNTAGILASVNFPSFPRFCGQIFWEAKDKELALLCIQAYNDWMVEEWCGTAPGRLIPLAIIPLWDPVLAATELERCKGKGVNAFAFSENPEPLGLPTIHDPAGYWDPVMAAANELEMVVCMHVGSSSTMPQISSNAPQLASLTWGANRTSGAMLTWLFSSYLQEMPNLKICLSEGNIGWMPYFLERAEQVLDKQRHWAVSGAMKSYTASFGFDDQGPIREADPMTLDVRATFRDHIYGCFIDDVAGINCLHLIGEDNVMVETDYPHSDTTWPHSIDMLDKLIGHLPATTQRKIKRTNAEKLFQFTPVEPTLSA
ncbi:MAG: amidohydrolase [Acidimicrobiales bacterium]|nr:amidohydrolase [Acidimicrobiales bacterium]